MTWQLHRHDARHISQLLEPESVDLIVTSPPYFALRSYRDGGEHFPGQLGSEATPGEFVDNLIACTADWLKVLKPGGSLWVNLGDKYAGSNDQSGGFSGTVRGGQRFAQLNGSRDGVRDWAGIAAKSLMGLPWRYALRCIDQLGLILRAEIIWSKPNGLPESVTDRVRRSHEQWFHFTRQGRYFAAIDEVREPNRLDRPESEWNAQDYQAARNLAAGAIRTQDTYTAAMNGERRKGSRAHPSDGGPGDSTFTYNPLGKVPGSVWSIPSEPLTVPDQLGVDHFAAFPSELPRRIILGWSPTGWCTACGEPRRAVVDKRLVDKQIPTQTARAGRHDMREIEYQGWSGIGYRVARDEVTITGYSCACPTPDAPTQPATILDPFTGTGTTPAVAHHLGRHGIGTDLSNDYLRLAQWRCTNDHALRDKVLQRAGLPAAPTIHGQLSLLDHTEPQP